MKKQFTRLPKDVIPINYKIQLTPDLTNFIFQGYEIIHIKIQNPIQSIKINSAEIKIHEVFLETKNKNFDNSDIKVNYDDEEELVIFDFPDLLEVCEGTLRIRYEGILNDRMKGFYRSKYTTPKGEIRYGAATQFEATEARRAFPCWDEPAIKATFDIILIVPNDRVALSNMPEVCRNIENDKVSVTFTQSPIMSTYLVAFIVGEYEYVEKSDADGVLIRVYTPIDKKQLGIFALDVAVLTLPFYKNYFGIAYPLPKMDLIAIADFAGGAMENWGLITYRETALLIDPLDSSISSKQRVSLVVGHEIAHMWFGNLVTMDWWTDLWLKEGFATWIEYLCVDYCFPNFDIWTQFATSDFTRALELDGLNNSHPIEVTVGHPSEIDEIFDGISYSKGASIIRMLHSFIGDENFRKGLQNYLAKHQYKNTVTNDLWDALSETSSKPISQIMNTWTKQMGYPIINVTRLNETTLKLKQTKFTAGGLQDKNNQLWSVPITVCSQISPNNSIVNCLLDVPENDIIINHGDIGDWIKINMGGTGFYRTLYDNELFKKLIDAIKKLELSPRDRLAIQDDMFALSRSGLVGAYETLEMIEAFKNETNYTVWSDLSKNISFYSILYQYTEYHEQFKAFKIKVFQPVFSKIGWNPLPDEGPLNSMLRALLISQLGVSGDKDVIEIARKKFNEHIEGTLKIASDLRLAIYRTVLRHGTKVEFDQLIKLYRKADMQEERVRIIQSLGSSNEPDILNEALKFSISDEVRSQDTVSLICGCTGSVVGRDVTWCFLKKNWDLLQSRYRGGFLLSRLVKTTTEMFASEAMALEIEEFFQLNPAPAAERNILQSLENIRLNIAQIARDTLALATFFKNH